MRSRNRRVMNARCSVKCPFSASVSTGILDRIRRLARSAISAGSAVPWLSMRACSINRPDTPVMSLATEDLLPIKVSR